MAGWPSTDQAGDQRLAQALQAGDETALAEIYDIYAPRLYDYCHLLLRDQETAALALHDALITVRERISGLPDLRLFRGWLYALTRAGCLYRRSYTEMPGPGHPALGMRPGADADESTRLAHAALLMLSEQQREALDLALRHELAPHELAEVLSVSPHEAEMLVVQARSDLDDAFAAVVVAATGRDDCPSVRRLAGPPGQPLSAQACGQLVRHIGDCPICGLRGNRKVATARLLNAMPVLTIPPHLRERVLTTATGPEYADIRATIAMRADPPGPDTTPDTRAGHRRLWPVLGVAGVGAVVVGGIFFLMPDSNAKHTGGIQPLPVAPSAPSDLLSPSSSAAPTPTKTKKAKPKPSRTTKKPSPTPTRTRRSSPKPGRLAVAGCHMDVGEQACTVLVKAVGGPVRWKVTDTKGSISASGGGSLAEDEIADVTVFLKDDICVFGGNGSVIFNSGVDAPVDWDC